RIHTQEIAGSRTSRAHHFDRPERRDATGPVRPRAPADSSSPSPAPRRSAVRGLQVSDHAPIQTKVLREARREQPISSQADTAARERALAQEVARLEQIVALDAERLETIVALHREVEQAEFD